MKTYGEAMTFKEKTLSSEYIYKGKIINLRKDNVEIVNGKTSFREIVEHNGGVGLAVLTERGKMILVRQFRKAVERDILELSLIHISEPTRLGMISYAV